MDAVLVNLFTSLSATLRFQLTTTVSKHVFQGDASQPPTLSNLPVIWGSTCATQVTILSTQIALELCTARAVKEVSSTHTKAPLQNTHQEICNLISVASRTLRGKSSVTTTIPEVSSGVPQSDSQVCIDSNIALNASASNVCGVESALSSELLIPDLQTVLQPPHASEGVLSRDQTSKLQSVVLTLSAYTQRIAQLCNNQSDGQNLSESFTWQSMLHYSWQREDERCTLSTLGASVTYGYHYCGSWARVVLTPATEKVLTYLLKAVQDRSNPLLLGPPVSSLFVLTSNVNCVCWHLPLRAVVRAVLSTSWLRVQGNLCSPCTAHLRLPTQQSWTFSKEWQGQVRKSVSELPAVHQMSVVFP